MTLTGRSTPGATLALQPFGTLTAPITATARADGTFSIPGVPLALGANSVSITASDVSGPGATLTASILRDPAPVLSANPVLTWNQQLLNSMQALALDPEMGSRAMALESVAVQDTIAAVEGRAGFLVSLSGGAGLNKSAALSAAAHDVLAYLFPTQKAALDATLAQVLSQLGVTSGSASVTFGSRIAAADIAIRDRDGWNNTVVFSGGTGVGQWRPTAPDFTNAQQPQFATLQPWLLNSDSQFRAAPPPAVGSAAYDAALLQVESLGAVNSTTRTADQTDIAKFWNDGSGSTTPPGHWDAIAAQILAANGQDVDAAAATLAELNVAMADAGVAAWDTKYTYDFWRPITAAQAGDANVAPDPSYQPLIKTPPHPSYVSGHSDFSSAAAAVLDSVFGPTSFSVTSLTDPGVVRSFTSFDAAAQEAAMSRIYAGIHFSFDSAAGAAQGAQVGQWTLGAFSNGSGSGPQILVDVGVPSYTTTLSLGGYALDDRAALTAISASVDGGAAQAVAVDASGRFSLSTASLFGPLLSGQHTLALSATDVAGRTSTQSVGFAVGGVATLTVSAPGSVLAAGAQLTGTVATPAGVSVRSLSYAFDGGTAIPVAVDSTGAFTAALGLGALAAGAHTLTVSALDSEGGTTTTTLNELLPALIPLVITAATPDSLATDVGVTYRPEVIFSRAVDPASVTAQSLFVTDAAGNVVPTTITLALGNTAAFLLPAGAMPGGSQLTLHVEGATIRGAADGAALATGSLFGTRVHDKLDHRQHGGSAGHHPDRHRRGPRRGLHPRQQRRHPLQHGRHPHLQEPDRGREGLCDRARGRCGPDRRARALHAHQRACGRREGGAGRADGDQRPVRLLLPPDDARRAGDGGPDQHDHGRHGHAGGAGGQPRRSPACTCRGWRPTSCKPSAPRRRP